GAEDDRVARVAELAARASLQRGFLPAQRLLRAEQVIAGHRHVAGAEVAMVAQRPPKRVERVGQRRAGRLAQRLTRSGVDARAAARSVRMWPRMASATARLGMRGRRRSPPHRSIRSTSLSSASKPIPDWLTSLATSRSTPLPSSLARA